MATERKRKNPTQAALSAVENALNLDPVEHQGHEPEKSPPEPRLPEIAEEEFLGIPPRAAISEEVSKTQAHDAQTGSHAARTHIGVVSPDRAAVANDDRQAVGAVLQALQARPSRRAYVFAALASLAWLGGLAA
jgi:hypothetical protein